MAVNNSSIRFLEKRLEFIKHLGNAQMNYLKRLYDGAPIFERYLKEQIVLHLHGITGRTAYCLNYRLEPSELTNILLYVNQASVLVEIGQVAERSHPVASLVRLKLLEECDIFLRNSFEMGMPPTLEDIWVIFNRKLDVFANSVRALLGQSAGEIIHGAAEAVRTLTDADSDLDRDKVEGFLKNHASGLKVRIIGNVIDFMTTATDLFYPRQVFVCPIEQGFDVIEYVQRAISHERQAADSKNAKGL